MKFSIITPVYNGEKYIKETIESLLIQEGEFDIELIVQDGGSTDNTVHIANEYISKLKSGQKIFKCNSFDMRLFSERDNGMYDAINKGFEKATGEIFAWLNSDDTYLPGALKVIENYLSKSPEVLWIKGMNIVTDENGEIKKRGRSFKYYQSLIKRGVYGRYAPVIEQETVFWRRSLWEKVGPINSSLRLAGDYWLWIEFAKYTKLYSINIPVARFRRLENSLSNEGGGKKYRAEQAKIMPPKGSLLEFSVKLFYWIKNKLNHLW
ncbi:MAG: glycosyl transferase 2 family protein [Candidatus Taylorbacteria bacterium]|nr:glycosyl transferase 2 family protein [Candidatus Taylorbacteria bacterium]